MKRLYIFFLLFSWISLESQAQRAEFVVKVFGEDTGAYKVAAEQALSIWSDYLMSSIPIKIDISVFPFGSSGPLGITFPNGRRDFEGAPVMGYWYPTALANAMVGEELNPEEADMHIYMNASTNWYFGVEGSPSNNQMDFISVFLHEVGHGLGFLSLAKVDSGQGSFGELLISDFGGIPPSFGFPDLDGRPSIFDYFVQNQEGQFLTDTTFFTNPSIDLGNELMGNLLYFAGEQARQAGEGQNPRLYVPSNFMIGSSITHLNETTYPSGSVNTLMTPFISNGQKTRSPGPICIGILNDLGWNINAAVPTLDIEVSRDVNLIYPNPVQDILYFHDELDDIEIYDGQYRKVLSLKEAHQYISIDNLPSGSYIFRSGKYYQRFIKL